MRKLNKKEKLAYEKKTKTKTRKPRKPKEIHERDQIFAASFEKSGDGKGLPYVIFKHDEYNSYLSKETCRRLGEWLLKAADYLEAKR